MKRIIGIIISVGLFASLTNAQNEVDALRYSLTNIYGTARSMSMGGAFGALGADFSANSYNPAGIGLYSGSAFSITPTIGSTKINSIYNGTASDDSRERFFLSSIGVTVAQPVPKSKSNSGWKYINFSFGLNRLNDFNNYQIIEGVNSQNSMADIYARLADGIYYTEIEDDYYGDYAFDISPAWWTYLIDTLDNGYNYTSSAPAGPVNQSKIIESRGSINEIVLSFGANYLDQFYIGASLGFPFIRYNMKSYYTETKLQEDINPTEFREFQYDESLQTRGTGVNIKIGMIFRPVKWVRIGGAFHSPTWYTNLADEWWGTFYTRFDTPDSQGNFSYAEDTPLGNYNYSIRTPLKAMGSLAFVIGPYGLISGDYEFIDYSTAKLTATDYSFLDENQSINAKYTSTHNFRVGTEWRFMNFSFRGGFAFYASPFKDNINDGKRNYYSAGIGYRAKYFFADFAWTYRDSKEDYYLYAYDDIKADPTNTETTNQNFVMTLGFRFN